MDARQYLESLTIYFDMDNKQEIFPLVDEEGMVIGSATRGECQGIIGTGTTDPLNTTEVSRK